MTILIKNGRVLDPATGTDGIADVLMEEGRIRAVEPGILAEADRILDADGCFYT